MTNICSEKWISVNDRLPNLNEDVLCFSEKQHFVGYRTYEYEYDNHGGWSWAMCDDILNADCNRNDVFDEVTHWMPLPESPRKIKEHKC